MNNINVKTKNLTVTAILFAIALVLSVVENMLPQLAIPVPGVKLGLSNIVVMYCLFLTDSMKAMTIVILKALFVVMTRGVVAGILSGSGGFLSVLIMLVLMHIFKDKVSYLIISIFGAIFHNIGQFIAISFIYEGLNLWYYLPILLIFGIIAGILTSILLNAILPKIKNIII